MISHNCDITEFVMIICDITWFAAGWRWLLPPRSSTSSTTSLAVANELERWIDLDWYCLDASSGLFATLAGSIMNGGCFVVILEGELTLAAHACIAHNTDVLSEHAQ